MVENRKRSNMGKASGNAITTAIAWCLCLYLAAGVPLPEGEKQDTKIQFENSSDSTESADSNQPQTRTLGLLSGLFQSSFRPNQYTHGRGYHGGCGGGNCHGGCTGYNCNNNCGYGGYGCGGGQRPVLGGGGGGGYYPNYGGNQGYNYGHGHGYPSSGYGYSGGAGYPNHYGHHYPGGGFQYGGGSSQSSASASSQSFSGGGASGAASNAASQSFSKGDGESASNAASFGHGGYGMSSSSADSQSFMLSGSLSLTSSQASSSSNGYSKYYPQNDWLSQLLFWR